MDVAIKTLSKKAQYTHLKIFLICVLSSILFQSCHFARFFTRNVANITDHKIFPYTEINVSEKPFYFTEAKETSHREITIEDKKTQYALGDFLKNETKTTAFLIIKNDEIIFENYYRGYDKTDISNIFSASKSVTSLLSGIAIDEGYIHSIDDNVIKYIPELNDANPNFKRLTVSHLLNMRSGIKFKEAYFNPFADVAKLYYGTNQLKQIENLKFETKPGTKLKYQSIETSILGTVIERATGKELGKYLEEKIWLPLGMENYATWSLDDKKHRSTKAFCCLNTTARDLAKIGRLFLNNGTWNGQQIVSKGWIEKSITPNADSKCYQNLWYNTVKKVTKDNENLFFTDSISAVNEAEQKGIENYYVHKNIKKNEEWQIYQCNKDFYAKGMLGQFIYVNPSHNVIIVRLGKKKDKKYINIFRQIVDELKQK